MIKKNTVVARLVAVVVVVGYVVRMKYIASPLPQDISLL